jgi:GAF domain-containing protein
VTLTRKDKNGVDRSVTGSGEMGKFKDFEIAPGKTLSLKIGGPLTLKTEVVNDYQSDPDFVKADAALFEIRSLMCAPLTVEGQGRGIVNVYNKLDGKKFSKSDALLLSSLADHVAIALENANLLSSLNQRVRTQLLLLESALSMQRQIDSSSIYELVADRLRDVVHYDAITIYRADHQRGVMVPQLARGSYVDEVMGDQFPIGEGITGYVAKTGVAEMVNEAISDHRAVVISGTPQEKEALMAIPLKGKETVIGVLTMYRDGGRSFTANDFEIAQLFSSQAASVRTFTPGSLRCASSSNRLSSSARPIATVVRQSPGRARGLRPVEVPRGW